VGQACYLAIPVPTLAALRAAAGRVGPPLLLGLLAAVLATQLQPRLWRGQAQVYFKVPNLAIAATSPTSLATSWPVNGATLYLEAQAKIARSPALAERVVQVAGVPGISARMFLRHSSAKPESDADILRLSVTYRSGAAAVRLSNAYAAEFTRYKHELDMRSIREVLRWIEVRINELRARGQAGSATHSALVQRRSELRSLGVQLRTQMSVEAADRATSFRPHALRNGLLGGALGALLGVALAVGIAGRRA
jgi:uncharacterized protein involved in exopolysaccharide biosynthesis